MRHITEPMTVEEIQVARIYHEAQELYQHALTMAQDNVPKILNKYAEAYDHLLVLPVEEWRDDYFMLAMSICNHGLILVSDVATPNTLGLAKNMRRLYKRRPDITDLDYRLAAAKAIITPCHHDLFTREAAREKLPDIFSEIYQDSIKILDAIHNDIENIRPSAHHTRHTDLVLCCRMMGYACLHLADDEKALHYYSKSIAQWAHAPEKNKSYFHFLTALYSELANHFSYDVEYQAIFSFAARLFDGTEPNETDVSFKDLSAIYQQIKNNGSGVHAGKLLAWHQLLDLIQERLEGGAFTVGEDGKYLAALAKCRFRREMEKPYYRQRFAEIRLTFHKHHADFQACLASR
jgi:hypothetical protein